MSDQWCPPNAGVFEGPGCRACGSEYKSKKAKTDWMAGFVSLGIYLCPDCGNKRCPKATWHGYKCTGSNDTGQEGEREPVITPPSEGPVFGTPEWQKKAAEVAEHFAKLMNKENP